MTKHRRFQRYIRSMAWRTSPARLLELERSGGMCRLCGRGAPEVRIEVHHRHYAGLGREDVSDLCSDCHQLVTEELRRRGCGCPELPVLEDTPRVLAGRPPANGRL